MTEGRVSKIYTFKNGNRVYKALYYRYGDFDYYWVAEEADGSIICSDCGSYERAYAIANSNFED